MISWLLELLEYHFDQREIGRKEIWLEKTTTYRRSIAKVVRNSSVFEKYC